MAGFMSSLFTTRSPESSTKLGFINNPGAEWVGPEGNYTALSSACLSPMTEGAASTESWSPGGTGNFANNAALLKLTPT